MLLVGIVYLIIDSYYYFFSPIFQWTNTISSCGNELIHERTDIFLSYDLKIKFQNNNKKSFLDGQHLLICFIKKHNITLMILLMNQLTFYSKK